MYSKFAERFRELHDKSGLSQAAAAERIYTVTGVRIPQTTLSGYLSKNEPQVPSVTNAAAIAETYNVSIEWLCGMTDDRRPIDALIERLKKLDFSPDVEETANMLAQLPDGYRDEVIGKARSVFDQWQIMHELIETARLMDTDGRLMDRIRQLSGVDPDRLKSPKELVRNGSLDNSDTGSVNQCLALGWG